MHAERASEASEQTPPGNGLSECTTVSRTDATRKSRADERLLAQGTKTAHSSTNASLPHTIFRRLMMRQRNDRRCNRVGDYNMPKTAAKTPRTPSGPEM